MFPVQIAGTGAGRPLGVPVIQLALDILPAVCGEFLNRTAGAGRRAVMKQLIAGLAGSSMRRQYLMNGLIDIKGDHGRLVNDIDHFLHVVQHGPQAFVMAAEFVIGIGGQQDIAEYDGKGIQAAQALGVKFSRMAAFKADAAHGIKPVGDYAVGEGTQAKCGDGRLIDAVCCGSIFTDGHDAVGGGFIAA